MEKESIFAIKIRKSCTIISFPLEISSSFLYFLQKQKSYKDIHHLILKPYFKALNWGIISVNNINNFGENQEIMQGTQIHSKWSFWYFWVDKTSKQFWILACRTILDEYIPITAKPPVVWYTRKYFKALKLVFHVIPAYKTSWTEKWHFAPLCTTLQTFIVQL